MKGMMSGMHSTKSSKEGSKVETAKMEEEVKLAELETRLRTMIIDLIKPSVQKITGCQADIQDILGQMSNHSKHIQDMSEQVQLTTERSKLILEFKHSLEECAEGIVRLDARLSAHEKAVLERIAALESRNNVQASWNGGTDRTLERFMQDIDVVHTQIRRWSDALDVATMENRQLIQAEAASLRERLGDLAEEVNTYNNEIWGPEECDGSDMLPPSLRRLDVQTARLQMRMADMAKDVASLRRLDGQMAEVTQSQTQVETHISELTALSEALNERVTVVARETKEESQTSANRMAAFTASILQEVRGNVEREVKGIQEIHQELQGALDKYNNSIRYLQNTIDSIGSQVSASFKQVHQDLEEAEAKRRRDRQTWQDRAHALQTQVASSFQASESTLKGLEQISSVVSMSLQGQRIAIAMDIQDFLERKKTPYVGIRESARATKSWEARNKEGIDPTMLSRLMYQPKPIAFQGTTFERAQLCALREKLVHAAQELLAMGPQSGGPKKFKGISGPDQAPPAPIAPVELDVNGDLPPMLTDRRPATTPGQSHPGQHSRPGSRGQPSARGSPHPERGRGGDHRDTPESARPATSMPADRDRAGTPLSGAGAGAGAGGGQKDAGHSEAVPKRLPALPTPASAPSAASSLHSSRREGREGGTSSTPNAGP